MRPILPLRFESIQTLQESATSSTFVATDHVLGRNNVVVKAIRKRGFTEDRSSLVELFSWYRGLRHPHIAEILDAGLTPRDDLFYVREFAPAAQLFSTRDVEALNILLGAVDFLHSMGRVHGAIKPSNVLARSNSVQLADPWIPQPGREPSSEEEVRFSAPEVLKGHPRTVESDLFSVGALLYRFFSGRDLFDDADLESLIARHIWASPRPLSSVSYVSSTIADIVENLIHKDPSNRKPAFESLKNELHVSSSAAARSPAVGMGERLEKAERFLREPGETVRILTVEGPVGFGKTRFIQELRQRMAFKAPNLVFSMYSPAGRSPEVALAQSLLSVFEQHCTSFDDPSLRRLQSFVDDDSKPGYDTGRIVHDLVDVLTLITRRTPLALVVEDIDRAKGKLSQLIDAIIPRSTRLHLCLVLSTRPGGIKPGLLETVRNYAGSALEHISLVHLPDDDAKAIATYLEPDEARRAIAVEKAGGNPLFLEEYCKSQKPGVPRLVRSTMLKQVSALPRQSRRLAEVLSLFEEPVGLEVLQDVTGIGSSDLLLQLAYLRNSGLSDDSIAIRHTGTRALLRTRIPIARHTELQILCYEHLKNAGIDKRHLALHAYHGALFTVAARLNLELAQEAIQSQLFESAVRFYEMVKKCRNLSSAVAPASIEEEISIAKCRAIAGDYIAARSELRRLLKLSQVQEDSELLSSVYSALASQYVEPSNKKRIRLLNLAIAALQPDSPMRSYRYGSLANAFLAHGDFDASETAIDKALTSHGGSEHAERARGLRTVILMNRGKFKEAADSLAHDPFQWAIPLSVKMNLAVCLEQIGSAREAQRIQLDVLQGIKAQGTLPEFLCLANLASIESKLGNAIRAQNLFESAMAKQSKVASHAVRTSCYSDSASHSLALGQFSRAVLFISKVDYSSDHGFRFETFQAFITRGELYLALGNYKGAAAIFEQTRKFAGCGDYFEVERLLLRAGFQDPSGALCSELADAAHACMRLETQYQLCRVLITKARGLLALGDVLGSRKAASEALSLALQGGYRMLAAQALLRRGLAGEDDTRKHSDLVQCFQEASTMGLLPLIAECAFHIGVWRTWYGDYPAARDFFFKSVSITGRIAEDLSTVDRKTFLSLHLNKEARRLLEDATSRTKQFHAVLREPLGKGELLFGGLYRLTSSMRSNLSFGSTVSTLVYSINECLQRTGAVVLETERDTILHPLNENSPDDMSHRARAAFSQNHTRTYFSSFGKRERQGAFVWVPIPCSALRAGIYIESSDGSFLDEQEIQFLTVIAAIAAVSLDEKSAKRSHQTFQHQEYAGIIGASEVMKKVYVDIEIASGNSASVLIEGESGTGKELVAKAIHGKSLRAMGSFVPVDCGALPEDLIEAELFGVRKGSFTGANEDRRGLFEEAEKGTVFLDEIANASPRFQTKLLRVLQEREIRRVGDTKGKRVDVRIIAATNCNLQQMVDEGRFRQDLLFRLKVLHIRMPPLRERKADIQTLAKAFLGRLNALNQTKKSFGAKAVGSLLGHDYPGNVRELQNAVEQAFYRSDRDIIEEIALDVQESASEARNETQVWFRELSEGRGNFWSAVRDRFKQRDISREWVLALVDFGLRSTRGNYKAVASMFKVKESEYHRFMDFLRRNDCLLDFRPYRRTKHGI